jgi:VTC domain-containing protein
MSGRLEYKYLVPNSLIDAIRDEIRPYVSPDPVGGKDTGGTYTVRSIYYDTPGFSCYDAKLDGLKIRAKFRIRGYDRPTEQSQVFLEIKRKYGGFIDKHRAPLMHRDLETFMSSRDIDRYIEGGQPSPQARRDAARFLYHYCRFGLHPAVLVVYDREAFFASYDPTLRLTFDKNLRRTLAPALDNLYDDDHLASAMSRSFIFEVKFFRYSLPGWIRSVISRYRLPRMALSKYTICLDTQPSAALSAVGRGRRVNRRMDADPIEERIPC